MDELNKYLQAVVADDASGLNMNTGGHQLISGGGSGKSDSGGKKIDLEKHDKRFHPDGFDPRTDHCSLRENNGIKTAGNSQGEGNKVDTGVAGVGTVGTSNEAEAAAAKKLAELAKSGNKQAETALKQASQQSKRAQYSEEYGEQNADYEMNRQKKYDEEARADEIKKKVDKEISTYRLTPPIDAESVVKSISPTESSMSESDKSAAKKYIDSINQQAEEDKKIKAPDWRADWEKTKENLQKIASVATKRKWGASQGLQQGGQFSTPEHTFLGSNKSGKSAGGSGHQYIGPSSVKQQSQHGAATGKGNGQAANPFGESDFMAQQNERNRQFAEGQKKLQEKFNKWLENDVGNRRPLTVERPRQTDQSFRIDPKTGENVRVDGKIGTLIGPDGRAVGSKPSLYDVKWDKGGFGTTGSYAQTGLPWQTSRTPSYKPYESQANVGGSEQPYTLPKEFDGNHEVDEEATHQARQHYLDDAKPGTEISLSYGRTAKKNADGSWTLTTKRKREGYNRPVGEYDDGGSTVETVYRDKTVSSSDIAKYNNFRVDSQFGYGGKHIDTVVPKVYRKKQPPSGKLLSQNGDDSNYYNYQYQLKR